MENKPIRQNKGGGVGSRLTAFETNLRRTSICEQLTQPPNIPDTHKEARNTEPVALDTDCPQMPTASPPPRRRRSRVSSGSAIAASSNESAAQHKRARTQ